MKRILLSFVAIATISLCSFGQAPEVFKYQAVVRDAGNVILNNQAVGMQLTIQQGSVGGTAVYTETFATASNAYGLVNLEIGSGTTVDDFSTIDWATGPYFIETAVDVTGGTSYVVMGTSQLMSVPYALHAKTSESALIDNVDDADSDPSNELQTISRTGSIVTLSNGGGTYTDSVNTYTGGSGIDITNNVVSASDPTYTIGFWPELGGFVFWVSPNGKHGLVASLQDQASTNTNWYDAKDSIVNSINYSPVEQQFRDWRLPTRYELNDMYPFSGVIGLNTGGGIAYWSSTEGSGGIWVAAMGFVWESIVPTYGNGFDWFIARAVREF